MEDSFDLESLIQTIKKKLLLIVVLAILGAGISGAYTNFLLTPIYQASTQVVLIPQINTESPLTHGEINVNLQMINTFIEVMASPLILNDVITELDLQLTTAQLNSMMSVRSTNNSQVVTLNVQNEQPELARDIANSVVKVFKEEIATSFNMDNMMILAPALTPTTPIGPRLILNTGIGFLIGLMFGLFLAFLIDLLDKTITSEQEVEKLINVPVIGIIPFIKAEDLVNNEKYNKNS